MKEIKIAIHKNRNSFSDSWINYCQEQKIPYKEVDCYSSDIIQQIEDCDALLWHFYQASPKDFLFAKQLLFALESSGKLVFPDFRTSWHFDDKVGQKYLLEAMGIPLIPSFVFYSKSQAMEWAQNVSYPKVFKLRSGAGSTNVQLVSSKSRAKKLINRAFGRGFSLYNRWFSLKERMRLFRKGETDFIDVLVGLARIFIPTPFSIVAGRARGYVYFQDFIANNDSDIRINVVGDRAYGFKRMVRKNDFRASGSGEILYDKAQLDIETVGLSFEIAGKLGTQCVVLDFLYDKGSPLLGEISYGFDQKGYDLCQGYWDKDLVWHEGKFDSRIWMIDDLVKKLSS